MCEHQTTEDFVDGFICKKDGKTCSYEGEEDQCPTFYPDFLNGYCDTCEGSDAYVNEEDPETCPWDKEQCWKTLPRIPYLNDIHKKKGKSLKFDVYIGRRVRYHKIFTKDSKWGNKFYKQLDLYEKHVRENLWNDLDELNGKIMGCWCLTTFPSSLPEKIEDFRCHGQILMKLFKEKYPNAIQSWR